MNLSPVAMVLVGLGGATGSMLRLIISTAIQGQSASGFPFGTLVVNIVGSFIIGLLIGVSIQSPDRINENFRLLIATGFCGGFTTFSAFSAETLALIDKGQIGFALTYLCISVIVGLTATLAGIYISK